MLIDTSYLRLVALHRELYEITTMTFPFNVLTVDLEDWIQSVYDPDAPLTDHFIRNTHRLLQSLADHDAKATFFVLGLCAEKSPELIREILAGGHEIQSHGFGHRLISTQTPEQFRQDVLRSKCLIEDLICAPITGYRAPGFSITRETLWALDILNECGFTYDSSIFPIRMRRYGITGVPAHAFRVALEHGSILELPVATTKVCGMRLPTGGGGYFRFWPYGLLKRAALQANRAGHPAIFYMHPYELNPNELQSLPIRIPWRTRIHQGLGRTAFVVRLTRLLKEFRFETIETTLSQCATPWFQLSQDSPDTTVTSFPVLPGEHAASPA